MFTLHYQKPVDSTFTGYIPWLGEGQDWRLSQASSKAEDDPRTPGNTADDLECSLPQGPIDKALKKFAK